MAVPKSAENMTLTEQAQEILRVAQKHGVEQNFFFITTFKRYQVQLKILNDLEKMIKDDGLVVSKEYVKGRKNVYSHPAIKDYNRTTDSANKTVGVLIKIIETMRRDSTADDEIDPLMQILAGGDSAALDENEPDDESDEDDDDEADEDEEAEEIE